MHRKHSRQAAQKAPLKGQGLKLPAYRGGAEGQNSPWDSPEEAAGRPQAAAAAVEGGSAEAEADSLDSPRVVVVSSADRAAASHPGCTEALMGSLQAWYAC